MEHSSPRECRAGRTSKAIQYGSQPRKNNLDTLAAISRFSGKQSVTASIFKAGSNLVDGLSKIKMGNTTFP